MKTPITYFGGKQRMLGRILPLIPEHITYVEPFAGGAAVFFAKELAKGNILNDTNSHLMNYYRVLQNDTEALDKLIQETPYSRDAHAHATHILKYPYFFDDVWRAWAVQVLSIMSFASKFDGSFGYSMMGRQDGKWRGKKVLYPELKSKLGHVILESRDALEVIRAYDTEGTFFFIDPPYIGTHLGHYQGSYNAEDFSRLLDQLSGVRGKFMLTMRENELLRDTARAQGWMIHEREQWVTSRRATKQDKKETEWMVCNYTLDNQ